MGTWGVGLFSDDTACDIRDEYREHIEDGVDDSEATRLTVDKFRGDFDDPDEGPVLWIAFAVTQSKIGRLDSAIRDKALDAIEAGADLARWEEENPKSVTKRRKVFTDARALLTGPQPSRKRLRPPQRYGTPLARGDVLALRIPNNIVLLCVCDVRPHRQIDTLVVEELDFKGETLPSLENLQQLKPKTTDLISGVLSNGRRFEVSAYDKISWEQARFEKIGTMTPSTMPDSFEPGLGAIGYTWSRLSERYRSRH
jgi:hypothetical protein